MFVFVCLFVFCFVFAVVFVLLSQVFSQFGQFPLEVLAKCRMTFWGGFKLVNINYKFKFLTIMYKFLYEMYREEKYKSSFLSTVETVLNGTGLSGMWTHQFDLNYSNQ